MILENKPTVIPVCIDGMDQVLPIGASFPRIFKRIRIHYGKPVDLSEFLDREKNRETAQLLMGTIMDRIRVLKEEIEASKKPSFGTAS